METVQEIGEHRLLKLLQQFCPQEIIGDDGAVVAVKDNQSVVITTDVLVEGVHFSDSTTSAEDVGWRSTAANLSDLAAMGATPLGITVGLSLPGEVPVSWVKKLYEGISSCLREYETVILGGDICRSSVTTISITALGQVSPQQVIRRHTAKPGDVIMVTGFHGGSKAGLELLLNPELGQQLTEEEKKELIAFHQRPQPRLDILPWLQFPVTGMDSSDGLADAVIQICNCSQVGAKLDRNLITYPQTLLKLVSPQQALNWALYGGEDFELVLCLPKQKAERLLSKLDAGAAIIGEITDRKEVELRDSNEVYPSEILSISQGFQHFSNMR
ncbi:MAG: thiamine-phosphate kinase [Spirulinaceae cyanobacterium]